MFAEHDCSKKQVSVFSLWGVLPETAQKRVLDIPWVQTMREDILPSIRENRFGVLYSEEYSRPNAPVNTTIGLLILKEIFGMNDEEAVESLAFDVRFRAALHAEYDEQEPVSTRTLTRFRTRLAKYEADTGIDLIHDCVVELAGAIGKLMGLSGSMIRMDSLMIAANIRRLGRTQLIYMCVRNILKADEARGAQIPEDLQHYTDPRDYNRIFYRASKEDAARNTEMILRDAQRILEEEDEEGKASQDFQLLERCLGEQTVRDEHSGQLQLRKEGDEALHSGILQNPSDPDASYRDKAGKAHQGYVANIEETCSEDGSLITEYEVAPNNVSDQKLLERRLENMERHEKRAKLIADGAYGTQELRDKAEEKNLELITTNLTGRDSKEIAAFFSYGEDPNTVIRCPEGYEPLSSTFYEKNGQIRLTFDVNQCASCPRREECGAHLGRKKAWVMTSRTAHERAKLALFQRTEDFQNLARIRNGVETIPSLLRNRYGIDRLPVRGLGRTKIFVGLKIAALNVKKLLTKRKNRGKYAQNPAYAQ